MAADPGQRRLIKDKPQRRLEAETAQHPQGVVGKGARAGPEETLSQVIATVQGVDQFGLPAVCQRRQRHRHGIDGVVAPAQILGDGAGTAAKAGDVDRQSAPDHPPDILARPAEFDEGSATQQADQRPAAADGIPLHRQIEITGDQPEQPVADGAAGDEYLPGVRRKPAHGVADLRRPWPKQTGQ